MHPEAEGEAPRSDAEVGGVIERAFPGGRLCAWHRLEGGVSAKAVRVELVTADGVPKRVVVRRPMGDSLTEQRRVVEQELRLGRLCHREGIRVQLPYTVDREALAVVLEYIEGAPDFAPADRASVIEQMATELAKIHALPAQPAFEFLNRREAEMARALREAPEQPDLSLDEPRVRLALVQCWPWPMNNRLALLHGDYWPGNLVWHEGQLAGVLDWEEAALGDPLADIAITRLDLWWAFGEQTMREFTASYRQKTALDWSTLAYWDLAAALRAMGNLERWATAYPRAPICRPDITAATMAHVHRSFVAQAFARLESTSA